VIQDFLFYALAVPAVLVAAISKGGFGGGLGILSVPAMALVVTPPQAAAIMLPILCFMDLFGLWAYWGKWSGPNMRIMLPGALVGIAVGALTFRYLDAAAIKLLIGLIALGFTLDYWFRGRKEATQPRGASAPRGGFWAAVSGYTSFVAHAGGPPASVYLLPQRLDKTAFVATTVIFFAVVNYVKLIPYAWLGQFDRSNLLTSLVLLPLAPIGMGLGIWLHKRVPATVFYRICYALVFVTGCKLVYDGVAFYAG
jgi:uncharacterized membrane protein YfcA